MKGLELKRALAAKKKERAAAAKEANRNPHSKLIFLPSKSSAVIHRKYPWVGISVRITKTLLCIIRYGAGQ